VKTGWQTKTLDEVSAINYGYTESANSDPVGPRFLRITDIQNDQVDWGNVPYCKIESAYSPKYRLANGDIVFARTGATTGKSFLVAEPPDAVFASYLIRLRLLDKKLLPEFVSLFFQTDGYWKSIKDGSSGSAQGGFNAAKLGALSIPVPPLPEQQRIVSILDEAFEAIATAKANAEKNLQNARALFESHLQSIFTQRGEGWVEKTLEELGTITSSKRIFKSEYVKSGVPFYRTKEIKELANGREITTELFISEARYKQIKATFGVPMPGDILLTAIGTIGEIYVVDGDNDFYFKDGNVLWLKEFTMINPHFLRYVLVSFVESLNKIAHGSAYSALPIQRLNVHKIFVPSQEEQKTIVSQLDSLNDGTQHLESIYQRKAAALDELKKSLLHQAFSGEL
jgi:type I restriction enzyme S subunit